MADSSGLVWTRCSGCKELAQRRGAEISDPVLRALGPEG
jgi:hypothetical protein